jgi:hypothetical protein
MLEIGISREAFANYTAQCHDLVLDVRYGCLVRALALVLAKHLSFDPVLARAGVDACLRRALFLAVSGHGSSREIFWLGARPRTAAGLVGVSARYAWSSALGHRRSQSARPRQLAQGLGNSGAPL